MVLLLTGWQVVKAVAGPLLFLMLLVPPPGRVVSAVTLPLQEMATRLAASVLGGMGWQVARTGNVLRLPLQSYEVAHACNGLRMVFAIVTLGAAMACLLRRPIWERIVLILSTVPVALAVNILRIVITGMISEAFYGSVSVTEVHDVAGWLMVPLAIMLLWGEQRFIRSLYVGIDGAPA
jgi:exosortase